MSHILSSFCLWERISLWFQIFMSSTWRSYWFWDSVWQAFLWLTYLHFLCLSICLCVDMCSCLVPKEAIKSHGIGVTVTRSRVVAWEQNPGPLYERQMPLTTHLTSPNLAFLFKECSVMSLTLLHPRTKWSFQLSCPALGPDFPTKTLRSLTQASTSHFEIAIVMNSSNH